jgi:murein L,D-transpeptidase YafK
MAVTAIGLPAAAQAPAVTGKLRDLKLLEEYPDGKGNIVRVVQYSEGLMRVRQTIIMPKPIAVNYKTPINPDTMHKEKVLVLVDKSDYSVLVYYNQRAIRAYRAVFGPRPMEDKIREGDRCTPEGSFTIQNLNPRSQYNKFMLLSYPNDSSKARFARLQSQGILPKTAKIGGSVGIHGIWPGGDDMIEMGVGWTDGCVALRNKDVDELFAMVGVGTKVVIRK